MITSLIGRSVGLLTIIQLSCWKITPLDESDYFHLTDNKGVVHLYRMERIERNITDYCARHHQWEDIRKIYMGDGWKIYVSRSRKN